MRRIHELRPALVSTAVHVSVDSKNDKSPSEEESKNSASSSPSSTSNSPLGKKLLERKLHNQDVAARLGTSNVLIHPIVMPLGCDNGSNGYTSNEATPTSSPFGRDLRSRKKQSQVLANTHNDVASSSSCTATKKVNGVVEGGSVTSINPVSLLRLRYDDGGNVSDGGSSSAPSPLNSSPYGDRLIAMKYKRQVSGNDINDIADSCKLTSLSESRSGSASPTRNLRKRTAEMSLASSNTSHDSNDEGDEANSQGGIKYRRGYNDEMKL